MSPGLAAVPGFVLDLTRCSHRVGRSVSLHQRELTLPCGVFAGREAVCISSTPSPKKLSLFCCLWLLACAPVLFSSCEWHSLAGSAGHTGAAHPFQASWESTGALVTQSLQVSTCSLAGSVPGTAAGAGGGFDLLLG